MEVDSDPEQAGLEERQQANDNGEREHGPEPMEGTMSESTQHRNHPEHLKGEFMWEIPNFSQIEHKEYSDKFEAGGSTWRLLVFPHGNNTDHLSVFLAIPDAQDLPSDWTLYAAFRLHLFSSRGHEHDLVKDAQHHFSRREVDWGYNTFIPLSELHDPARGFLTSGSLTLRVQVWVNPTTNPYAESRADTGFVGLKNQGATCYMNSLLQTLYAINAFRRAVYHMPGEEGDGARGGEATGAGPETGDKDEAEAIPAALQRVFWRLQFTDGPVGTKELTRSFGWDSSDAFQQHDVQELNRILCDRLEVRMKGTKVEGTIAQLFEGHTHNYIECLNVDCRSTRRESFQDLQLDVAGCRTVLDSFDRYCAPEILEGENQYVAEGHGLQDARKGVLFEDFPPVLQLQLKRFEYDYAKDAMVKLNTRYEFGDTLDLDSHGRRYLAPAANPAVRNLYRLLAVLVHSGGVHGGHYYAYVRPEGCQWLKFDDERVEKVEAHAAVEDNWGGGGGADGGALDGAGFLAKSNARAPPLARLARHANAYMLVYVRASEWDSVLCSIRSQDIPAPLRMRLEHEQRLKEQRKRDKAEAHLYVQVRVVQDADIAPLVERVHHFDLARPDRARPLRMPRNATLRALAERVEAELGVPAAQQRYWRWGPRQNGTLRPSTRVPLPALDGEPEAGDRATLASLTSARGGRAGVSAALDLYLEPAPLPALRDQDVLVFYKYYEPSSGEGEERLRYLGRDVVPASARVGDLHAAMRARAGLPEDAALEVFEEIKYEPSVMVELVRPTVSLEAAEISSGDILVFQRALPAEERAKARFPSAKEFMAHLQNRVRVELRPLPGAAAAPSGQGPGAGAVADARGRVLGSVLASASAGGAFQGAGSKGGSAANLESHSGQAPPRAVVELRRDMAYEDMSARAAAALGLDHPLKVRFTLQNLYTGLPRPQPVKWTGCGSLEDLLRVGAGASGGEDGAAALPLLYYEVLDMPLPELEQHVTLRVHWHGADGEERSVHDVRLLKEARVSELLAVVGEAVRRAAAAEGRDADRADKGDKAPPSLEPPPPEALLRLVEVYQWKIWQVFDPDMAVHQISTDATLHLRAERVPADQVDLASDPAALHVHCLHVAAAPDAAGRAFCFTDPWIMRVRPGETVRQFKARAAQALGRPAEEVGAWPVSVISHLSTPDALDDDAVISDRISHADLRKLFGHHDRPCLGFEHENKNPRKTHAHLNKNSMWYGQEKQLKIKA